MTQEIAKKETTALAVNEDIIERMQEIKDNLESIESFRLPRAKMTAEGFELIDGEKATLEINGVIIHTKMTNVYYAKPYNPSNVLPPDCFSLDGRTPDSSIEKPVFKTCKGCPMAEFGTNSMQSGKACRNLKPMFMLMSDESIMPRQVTITPANLRAANEYLMNLTERGIPYRKIKTKIVAYKENPKDTYMKLKFFMGEKLSEEQAKTVEFLKTQWASVMNAQMADMEGEQNASKKVESSEF